MEWCSKWKQLSGWKRQVLHVHFQRQPRFQKIRDSLVYFCSQLKRAHQNIFAKQMDHNRRTNGQCWKEQAKSTNFKSQFIFLKTTITTGLLQVSWMSPTIPLLPLDTQLNGGGSSFSKVLNSKSTILSAFEPGLCRHPGDQHWSLSVVRKKALWWRALDTTRQHNQKKRTPSHLETLLTCSLIKNLAGSSERYNYYFIWKNIYHANTEQIASSNKCLLNEHENIWAVLTVSTHTKRHLRVSNPSILLYVCKFPNMPEFSSYGWR